MAALSYLVIATDRNGYFYGHPTVHPTDGKPISRKDAQRLATVLLNETVTDHSMECVTATVVEVVNIYQRESVPT